MGECLLLGFYYSLLLGLPGCSADVLVGVPKTVGIENLRIKPFIVCPKNLGWRLTLNFLGLQEQLSTDLALFFCSIFYSEASTMCGTNAAVEG